MPNHNQNSSVLSPCNTVLFLAIGLLALFPTLFHSILWAPYTLLFGATPQPRIPTTVTCRAPNVCLAPPQHATAMTW